MSSKSYEKMLEEIAGMKVVELAEFVKAIEEKFGVTAAAPVAVAGAAPAASGAPAAEKTEFKVVLKEAGADRVAVIKAIKANTKLSVGEAKDLVGKAPTNVAEGLNKKEADVLKSAIDAAGGKAELQ